MLPAGAVAALALLMVPRFKEVFDAFDAELPVETQIVLVTYQWWWVAILLIGGACWILRARAEALAGIVVVSFVLSFLVLVFAGYACYAPIFGLSAAS
jgi:type II secretory pathway component PulF